MSDHKTNDHQRTAATVTVRELLRDVEPMGDLAVFAIDDLTAEDEDEFFGILDDA